MPCAPCSPCLEQGFTGSPIPLSPLQLGLLAIGSINLLVWAFLLGRCSSQSRVAELQPQVQQVRVGPLHWRGIISPILSLEDPAHLRERYLVITPDRDVYI